MAATIAYLAFRLCTVLEAAGVSKLAGIEWMLQKTPASLAFSVFALQSLICAAANIHALKHVSNHIIITLDIIYISSILMLILFHTFKIADHNSSRPVSF